MIHTEGCDGRHSMGECSDVVAARRAAAPPAPQRTAPARDAMRGEGRLRTIGTVLVITGCATLVVGALVSIGVWAQMSDNGKGSDGFMLFVMGIWTTIWTGLSMLALGGMIPFLLSATYDAARAAGRAGAEPVAAAPDMSRGVTAGAAVS